MFRRGLNRGDTVIRGDAFVALGGCVIVSLRLREGGSGPWQEFVSIRPCILSMWSGATGRKAWAVAPADILDGGIVFRSYGNARPKRWSNGTVAPSARTPEAPKTDR